MFSFKKSKYPNFRVLNNFHKKHSYSLRNTEWSWLDDTSILATDPQTSDIRTFTEWDLVIFNSARGDKTIEEYIYLVADQYPEKIPSNLDHVIIFKILELEKENFLILSDQKKELPKEYELPGLKG